MRPLTIWWRYGSVCAISVDLPVTGGHHTKMEMIGHSRGVSGLTAGAPDFLFDFLEFGFDFPSCSVEFDDLLDRKIEVGGKENDPTVVAEDSSIF